MAQTATPTKAHIVIVEDNPDQAAGLQRILAAEGITTDIASTGQAGLQLTLDKKPDLVLLDVNLPDTLGTDVCADIRQTSMSVGIILLSSVKISPEDHAYGLSQGADDYISRPFSSVEFLARVKAVLRTRQAEQALRHNRDQLEKIIGSMADGVLVVGYDDMIQFANQAAGAMFSIKTDDLTKQPFGHPVLSAEYAEIGIVRHDGEFGFAEMRVTDISWQSQPAWLIMLRDITGRKHLDARVMLQSTALEAAPYGVVITNRNGQIEWVNTAFTDMTGYNSASEVTEHSIQELLTSPDDAEQTAQIVSEIKSNARWSGQVNTMRKDGSTFINLLTTATITDDLGELTHLVGMMQDITSEKAAEEREAREKNFALALANNTATITSAVGNIDFTLDLILESVGDFIPHTGANILLAEGDSGTFRIARVCSCYRANGFNEPVTGQLLNLNDWPVMKSILNGGDGTIIPDVHVHPGWVGNENLNWIRSYAVAPIRMRGQLIGVLNVDHHLPNQYTEEHLQPLRAFAGQAAIAISNAQLYEQLQEQIATLDSVVAARTRELLEAKERIERTLRNSPDPIILLDADALIEAVNPAFHAVFGYEEREVAGHHLHFLIEEAERTRLEQVLAATFTEREVERLELVALRNGGSRFEVEIAISPVVQSDERLGFVCTLRDISQAKELERLKDQFVSNVSHELRTPLTNIKLNHHLLTKNPNEQSRYLARLNRETNRLLNLIEDLLRLSRIDQKRIQINKQHIDLNEVIDTFVRDRLSLVESSNRIIRFTPDPTLEMIQADPRLVEQILSILITNAIAYSVDGTEIDISTAPVTRDGVDWAAFSVTDTGLGIPPEETDKLFERFYRGWAAKETNSPGTGLGLAIASEIAKMHNGRIEVKSQTGDVSGTTFTVLLPVENENQPGLE